jgi:hypothetical protein
MTCFSDTLYLVFLLGFVRLARFLVSRFDVLGPVARV